MKQSLLTVIFLYIGASALTQGLTLLYKGGSTSWNDAENWIQINTAPGSTPIQRVPTEFDDVVFSKSMSGLSSGIFEFSRHDSLQIGGDGSGTFKCRSMHVSNFELSMYNFPDYDVSLDVYTNNGGSVIIDSGSNFRYGNFRLHGGDPEITDLVIENSVFGSLFSHQNWSNISVRTSGRGKFINSELGGFFFGTGQGGHFFAEDCVFKCKYIRFDAESRDTILNCQFVNDNNNTTMSFYIEPGAEFVSDSVDITPISLLYFYTSGSTLNGNIRLQHPTGTVVVSQADPLHPLPNIINGNLILQAGAHSMPIMGELKISGDLINNTEERMIYPDTGHILINGQDVMKVGGIFNYRNNTTITNCLTEYCHFKLEFFGNKNSNIFWPIGIPIDTLVINKSGCAKVTSTNSIYVSGDAQIKQGQLVLQPNQGIPYKMICAGNLTLSSGGGILLAKNAAGDVANLAIDGSLFDHNLVTDTTCAGLTNPYNGTITLYRSGINAGNRSIGIMGNTSLGNLHLIGETGSGFSLEHDLTVNNFSFTNTLELLFGVHNLVVTGDITYTPGGN